jgi:hypothetical protein
MIKYFSGMSVLSDDEMHRLAFNLFSDLKLNKCPDCNFCINFEGSIKQSIKNIFTPSEVHLLIRIGISYNVMIRYHNFFDKYSRMVYSGEGNRYMLIDTSFSGKTKTFKAEYLPLTQFVNLPVEQLVNKVEKILLLK